MKTIIITKQVECYRSHIFFYGLYYLPWIPRDWSTPISPNIISNIRMYIHSIVEALGVEHENVVHKLGHSGMENFVVDFWA